MRMIIRKSKHVTIWRAKKSGRKQEETGQGQGQGRGYENCMAFDDNADLAERQRRARGLKSRGHRGGLGQGGTQLKILWNNDET